jgi:hypothetical protein
MTVTWWHAVEDEATASGQAIADQLQLNKKLRAMFPIGILPALNRKKFYTGGSFRLRGQRIGDAPSLNCLGAGGEGTGKHSVVGVLDDFVGYNDVVDGQMPKKKQFYQATVCNVVMRIQGKFGWKDCVGTHWAIDDPYVEWRKSQDWVSTVRACMETEGTPDSNGVPVYLSKEQIEKERREQGSAMFSFQMMNDPSPSGEKPWIPAQCEHRCTLEEAKGAGWVLALGDPAPRAVGSVGGRDERMRRDGTKNWWANVVVKLRRKGELRQIIWLDAEQSKEWGLDEGMDNLVKMAMRWKANEGYVETTSTPVYAERFIRSARDLGWKGYIVGSRREYDPKDRLEQTYNSNAKVAYLTVLCDRAKGAEFIICESVPQGLVDTFLSQARGFMPLPDGRTGIPFDDLINALAFSTDPYFRMRYPVVADSFTPRFDPLGEEDTGNQYQGRTRHSAA